ncbi:energy transducer TonB [Sulfuriferula nivalis]|uniref:Transporter TonB n=1 Tax=Sulfuriferula nivalis TaxID=2675298 RepID=A0A809SB04_9PROT|nr:energy transducer TonB [Sulfuriferula nivalis]BBP02373.1 transporter TonB [Sulfuriferula nivalis]
MKLINDLAATLRLPVMFVSALLLSLVLHGLVLAMHFSFPIVSEMNLFTPPLEVVLVNSKSAKRPHKADALAQANLDGGGNTDDDRRAKSPLPAMSHDQRQSEAASAQQRVQLLEEQERKIMTQLKSNYSLHDGHPQTEQTAQPATQSGKGTLLEQSLEMAKLEAQIAQEYDAYQKRPRKLFIGASAQEYVFARYIEDWRIKVERIGNQNYPEEARRQKVYGKLQLSVSIKADGTLSDIEVTRSSGSKVLDDAAVSIVRRSAPYAPFPEDVRKKADVVVITRTWTFAPGDQLSTKE